MISGGIRQKISIIIYAALWAVSFVIAAGLNSLNSASLLFLLCSGGSAIYLMRHNEKTAKRAYKVILWLITIYFSFAFWGRSIFMQTERIAISVPNMIYFAIFVVVFYPLTPGILEVYERLIRLKQKSVITEKVITVPKVI